jgi:hypothetical protein
VICATYRYGRSTSGSPLPPDSTAAASRTSAVSAAGDTGTGSTLPLPLPPPPPPSEAPSGLPSECGGEPLMSSSSSHHSSAVSTCRGRAGGCEAQTGAQGWRAALA